MWSKLDILEGLLALGLSLFLDLDVLVVVLERALERMEGPDRLELEEVRSGERGRRIEEGGLE